MSHHRNAAVRSIESREDIAAGLAWLAKRDKRLKAVIAVVGALPLRRRPGGLPGLARIVIGQQVSVASANALWERLELAFPEMTADALHRARVSRLQKAGLSGAKIRALFAGRFAASIDDVRATALPALRHRILRSFEGEAEGVAEDKIIDEILKKLPESKG